MSSPKIYDALILGAGPAGLSAALTLSRVHRTVAIFTKPNNSGFRNFGAHAMHNVISRDGLAPEEFQRISKEQVEKYDTAEFFDIDIAAIARSKVDDGALHGSFRLEDKNGRTWSGEKVVLAMGVTDSVPDIEGYEENWPNNIYQCPFCDGHERSHLPFGILGFSDSISAHLASIARLLQTPESGPVTIFTNGSTPVDEPAQHALTKFEALGCNIETSKVVRLTPLAAPSEGLKVVLEDGSEHQLGFLLNRTNTMLNAKAVIADLGVEIEQHPMVGDIIKVDNWGKTNIPGVFAAGDSTTMIRAVVGSMYTGAMAGSAIVQQILADAM